MSTSLAPQALSSHSTKLVNSKDTNLVWVDLELSHLPNIVHTRPDLKPEILECAIIVTTEQLEEVIFLALSFLFRQGNLFKGLRPSIITTPICTGLTDWP